MQTLFKNRKDKLYAISPKGQMINVQPDKHLILSGFIQKNWGNIVTQYKANKEIKAGVPQYSFSQNTVDRICKEVGVKLGDKDILYFGLSSNYRLFAVGVKSELKNPLTTDKND